MGKLNYFLVAAVLGMVACSENEQSVPEMLLPDGGIVFKAQINPASRATETYFETNDAIGVFAVESSGSDVAGVLSGNGNYADNVRYVYDGSQFTSASGIEKVDGVSLYYHAVYPYCADAKATYEFDIQTNQQGTGYTESDLLTAQTAATSETIVPLTFNHRLFNLIVSLKGDNWPTGNMSLRLNDIYTSVNVDLNALTFTPTGNKKDVVCSDNGTKSFKVILPPQTLSGEFATLTVGGREYPISLAKPIDLNSGKQVDLSFEMDENGTIVVFTGDINPWEDQDVPINPDDDNPGIGDESDVKSCWLEYDGRHIDYTYAYLCDLEDGYYSLEFVDYDLYADMSNPVPPNKYINWLVAGICLPDGQGLTSLPEGSFEFGNGISEWDGLEGYYVNLSVEDWEDTQEYRNFNTSPYYNQHVSGNMTIRKSGNGYIIELPDLELFDYTDINFNNPMEGKFYFEGTLRYLSMSDYMSLKMMRASLINP